MVQPEKAYKNLNFLNSDQAREIRLLAEYLEPEQRLAAQHIEDTIVFFGSARARDDGEGPLASYYRQARELAHRLTAWSLTLPGERHRFVLTTGGGPGIMEAVNRGAHDAGGRTIGFGISLPHEQEINRFVNPELAFEFHYFMIRKFWLVYPARALIIFPGGFGTLDEFFEVLTLLQTGKHQRALPVVLFDRRYWNDIIDFEALCKWGTIAREDLDIFYMATSVDNAFSYLKNKLIAYCPD